MEDFFVMDVSQPKTHLREPLKYLKQWDAFSYLSFRERLILKLGFFDPLLQVPYEYEFQSSTIFTIVH